MSSELGWSSRLPNTSNLNSDTTTTKHRQVMSLTDTNKSCLKQSERESQRVRLRLHCPTERAAGLYETARLARRSTLSWCHVSPLLISHNKAPFNKSHIIGRIFVVRMMNGYTIVIFARVRLVDTRYRPYKEVSAQRLSIASGDFCA